MDFYYLIEKNEKFDKVEKYNDGNFLKNTFDLSLNYSVNYEIIKNAKKENFKFVKTINVFLKGRGEISSLINQFNEIYFFSSKIVFNCELKGFEMLIDKKFEDFKDFFKDVNVAGIDEKKLFYVPIIKCAVKNYEIKSSGEWRVQLIYAK